MGLVTTHTFRPAGSGCSWPSGLSTHSGCDLPHSSTYCVVVRALNAHGLWGERKHSNGQTVCTAGPAAGVVLDGTSAVDGSEADYTALEQVSTSWSGFSDECAPVDSYSVGLQRRTGSRWDAYSMRRVDTGWEAVVGPASEACCSKEIALVGEGHFRVQVCATNVLGQQICSLSDGFVADRSPPLQPTLCLNVPGSEAKCGPTAGAFWLGQQEGVITRWGGCSDPESGVHNFGWMVSTESDVPVQGWTNVNFEWEQAVCSE